VGFFSGRSGQVYPPEFDGISREDFFHHPQLLFNDSNAYHCAALEGLGIIQNSVAVLAPYLRTGQLVQILPHSRFAGCGASLYALISPDVDNAV
jgi:DNA-binding transcriptional LysR family regulator